MVFNRYEYPIIEKDTIIIGSYTIIETAKPLNFKGEVLVDSFQYDNKRNIK